ncbi:MAG: L-seryl-tRNA(Sec) selenium transferase [Myxococcales bacterium]|nr:L-seryl-tRNA(Sec) selenium transferase [Myxococcales bacterium]
MSTRPPAGTDDPRRNLPSVDTLLEPALVSRFGHRRVTFEARRLLKEQRLAAGAEVLNPDASRPDALRTELALRLGLGDIVPALNATGVILHTNLGRAPWSPEARRKANAAMGVCTIELDRRTGRRGRRGQGVEDRLCALYGAEAALVVNNCAAAVLLALSAAAAGRDVLVSRGELVEIGGGFRVPEVIACSGARLVEVGTTNRTHLADYQGALTDRVAAILRVSPSNFRQIGFVSRPDLHALAALPVPLIVDAGSGAVSTSVAMDHEDAVTRALDCGAALVCASGDKLLGGPQAGLLFGRRELIEAARAHPLFRALRPDKVTLAALEGTLDDHLKGVGSLVDRAIATPKTELADAVAGWLARLPEHVSARCVEVEGEVGGGSLPGRTWPSVALAIRSPGAVLLRQRLLEGELPVVGYIREDELYLDARTIIPFGEGERLLGCLLDAIGRC